jgi:hypothetical protein
VAPKKLTPEQAKEVGFRATYARDQFTYCCGGREAGGFDCYLKNRWVVGYGGYPHENRVYPTKYDAWKAELDNMRPSSGYPLMCNVREDMTPELAQLLREQDDCTEIMKWCNPNTGNIVTMFILTNGADEEYKESDNDD